jgi:hypothetical protein
MRTTVVLLALAAAGCLYDDPFLPGAPATVDARVLGKWRCVAPEQSDQEAAILTVSQGSDHTVRAEFAGGSEEPTVFSAYAVNIGGKQFLNAQEIDGSPKKWTVARYTLHSSSVLQIQFARDEPFREISKHRRLEAFKRELKGNRLFEDYCACIRIKGSASQ